MIAIISNFSIALLGVVGPWQLVAIIAVILLLFGGRKIPELMRGLGKGVKEFKNGMKEAENALKEDEDADKVTKNDGKVFEPDKIERTK